MSSSSSIQGPGGTTPPIDQSKISWHRGKTSSGKPVSSLTGETVLEKFKKPLEKIKTLCAPLLNQSETATEIPHKDIYATAVALKDLCTKENLSKMDPSQKIQLALLVKTIRPALQSLHKEAPEHDIFARIEYQISTSINKNQGITAGTQWIDASALKSPKETVVLLTNLSPEQQDSLLAKMSLSNKRAVSKFLQTRFLDALNDFDPAKATPSDHASLKALYNLSQKMNPSLDKESSTTTAAPSSAKTQIGRRSATNPPSDSVGDVNPPTQTSLPDVQSDLREQGE